MNKLKYKFGDTVQYQTANTIYYGIIWNAYDIERRVTDYTILNAYDIERKVTDYTILNDTQFVDVNESQIIKMVNLKSNDDINYHIQDFKMYTSRETITLINVITKSDKYDLQIVAYLQKALSIPLDNYKHATTFDHVKHNASRLLNLIKDKHGIQTR